MSLALELGSALERQAVPYAIGGALAYGVWGVPRATLDVDVNVFVGVGELSPVLAALSDLGMSMDGRQAESDSNVKGMFAVTAADE